MAGSVSRRVMLGWSASALVAGITPWPRPPSRWAGYVSPRGRLDLSQRALQHLGPLQAGRVVLSYQDGGVALYAEEVFRTCVEKPIEDLDPFDADAVDRVHALLATAADAVLGDGGFVHLPPHLIALLGVQDGGPVSITPDPQRLRVDAPR